MLHFPSPDIGIFGRRQRQVRGYRTPVSIRREAKAQPGCAVVVDTFSASDVMPLAGGCMCCTVRVELQSALRRLVAERKNKHFKGIIVETGHDLAPILRTFVTERALGGEFYAENYPADAFAREAEGIRRFMLTDPAPLTWEAFSRSITTLTALRGADLLQMKGLLNVPGCRGPVAVQFMGHLAARPVELRTWPSGDSASRLEFITRNLEETTVRELFDSVRALA
jgi:G3E family GTPase